MTRRLIFKLFLAVLPVLLMAIWYVAADPFMVLCQYPDMYNTRHKHLELNEDYAVTETFLRLYPQGQYDAYILGSSRSRYFTPDQWLKRKPGMKPFHFGVASETLFGVVGKVKMLHAKGIKISNALIIADAELLSKAANSSGHLFRKHPLVSGEGFADLQFTSFKDFFNPEAISGYLSLPDEVPVGKKDPQQLAEMQIEKDPTSYYGPRMSMFFKRPSVQQYEAQVIFEEQRKLLVEMKEIFAADNTDYRIVLSPMYDQKKLNTKDMNTLYEVFGKDHIYDFSGINDITQDMYNYFETAHYRPAIAYRIMDSVYARR